jgi:hypothetical protein
MLIQLLPWWGVAYPQVPEISSVVHQLPCFEVGFSLCWFTRGLFLCLSPFLWGKVRDPSASFLLSVCYAGLLIVFQFCSVVWLWMLLTGSGDELCGLLSILLQAVAYHLPTVGPSAFLIFVYWKFMQRSAPCTSPLLLCVLRPPCPLCSMFFFSFLFIIQGFFFFCRAGGGQSVQEAMLVYTKGGCGNITCHLFAHLLVCWMSPKEVSSQSLAAWEPSCFLGVTRHREALYRLGVLGVEAFLLVLFFCQVLLQHLSKIFDSQSSHCLLLYPSCYLDPQLHSHHFQEAGRESQDENRQDVPLFLDFSLSVYILWSNSLPLFIFILHFPLLIHFSEFHYSIFICAYKVLWSYWPPLPPLPSSFLLNPPTGFCSSKHSLFTFLLLGFVLECLNSQTCTC